MNHPSEPFSCATEIARSLPDSLIVEAADRGRQRGDCIALWAGEGNLPTDHSICQPAVEGLLAGETFYSWQRGEPWLREALAVYHSKLYGKEISAERFSVVLSGMLSLQIAMRIALSPGDDILIPSPVWPNFVGVSQLIGAIPLAVPMRFDNEKGSWHLDIETLEQYRTPRTRAIAINSPSNPLGWTASLDDLRELLHYARQHNLWIIADEVYGRFYYKGPRAPSFHDVADDEDLILYGNTFSKNWGMTGWRLGWIEAPASLGKSIANIVQYTTSGAQKFLQRGANLCLEPAGEKVFQKIYRQALEGRELCDQFLKSSNAIKYSLPDGGLYLFLRLNGIDDSRTLNLRMIDEAGVGLAPGEAFGPFSNGWLRLCFLRERQQLITGLERLVSWIGQQ